MSATKTVILMDHREVMAATTDQTISMEEFTAHQSKWTLTMEAVVEYTRIILDICPLSHPVSISPLYITLLVYCIPPISRYCLEPCSQIVDTSWKQNLNTWLPCWYPSLASARRGYFITNLPSQLMLLTADDKLTYLNSWTDQLGISKIVEQLARLGPPQGAAQHNLSLALQVLSIAVVIIISFRGKITVYIFCTAVVLLTPLLPLQQCLLSAEEMSMVDIQNSLLGSPTPRHARLVCFTSMDTPAECIDIVRQHISDRYKY